MPMRPTKGLLQGITLRVAVTLILVVVGLRQTAVPRRSLLASEAHCCHCVRWYGIVQVNPTWRGWLASYHVKGAQRACSSGIGVYASAHDASPYVHARRPVALLGTYVHRPVSGGPISAPDLTLQAHLVCGPRQASCCTVNMAVAAPGVLRTI